MTLTNTNASAFIRPNVQGTATDLTFQAPDLFDYLAMTGRVRDSGGSSPIQWNIVHTANAAAELFVENQAISTTGKQTYAQPSLAVWYARATAGITGHLRDQIARGGTYEDVLRGELAGAGKALLYLIETTLTGSAQDKGIASIIDATDVYAGVNPATVTAWASQETALGGALTIAALQDLYESLVGSPRGASPSAIVCAVNQIGNYTAIANTPGANSLIRVAAPHQGGAPYDVGAMGGAVAVSYNGVPFINVRTITTTELYMLDMQSAEFSLRVHRDLLVEPLAKTDDNDKYQLSMACALKIENRRRQGKLTGVTA